MGFAERLVFNEQMLLAANG